MSARSFHSVVQTHLSKKPGKSAFHVALWSVLVLMLATSVYWGGPLGLDQWLPATRAQVFERHEYWRLLTAFLIHADLGHFLSNVLYLGGLSYLLAGYFGWKVFPLVGLVAGMAVNASTLATYSPEVQLVGVSGLVYWMMGVWITLYAFLDRRVSVGRRIMNSIAFALILLVPQTLEERVSYRAHAIGFALGLLAGFPIFFLQKTRLKRSEKRYADLIRFRSVDLWWFSGKQ